MTKKTNGRRFGFTLIELVMVILLLSILAAVAIPNFIDFRTDAKNAATQGAIGALRSAISVALAAIQLKEDPTSAVGAPKYPTLIEMEANQFRNLHPVLSGVAIMDPANGIPPNPWTVSTATATLRNTMLDCLQSKTLVLSGSSMAQRGWCYRQTSGEIWANSDSNGAGATRTENTY